MAPSAPERPRSVSITLWSLILIGLSNLWLAYGLEQQMELLSEREAAFAPGLRLMAALLWAVLFLGLATGVWRRVRWVRILIPFSLLLFALYNVGALIFLGQMPYARQGAPLLALLYGIGTVLAGLFLNRPVARRYFEN